MRAAVDDPADLNLIIELVYDRCRVRLHDGKQQLIRARLGKRIRQLGFETLHQYCAYLRRGAEEQELDQVVDALTTNFTHFLREQEHFEFVVREALPHLLSGGRRTFRIWSGACATGEEPYSLALYLAEFYPPAAGWDWRIVASDVSGKALARAQSAIYGEEKLTGVPPAWLTKYFQSGVGAWTGQRRVKAWLRERVEFRQLNLLGGGYGLEPPFEVIFCRNVMIYFDRPTQEILVRRLSEFLRPGGYLLVGHAESLIGLSVPFECLRPSIYQRT